jgi:hypothetical protein
MGGPSYKGEQVRQLALQMLSSLSATDAAMFGPMFGRVCSPFTPRMMARIAKGFSEIPANSRAEFGFLYVSASILPSI